VQNIAENGNQVSGRGSGLPCFKPFGEVVRIELVCRSDPSSGYTALGNPAAQSLPGAAENRKGFGRTDEARTFP
jgi:hypothetical protein